MVLVAGRECDGAGGGGPTAGRFPDPIVGRVQDPMRGEGGPDTLRGRFRTPCGDGSGPIAAMVSDPVLVWEGFRIP